MFQKLFPISYNMLTKTYGVGIPIIPFFLFCESCDLVLSSICPEEKKSDKKNVTNDLDVPQAFTPKFKCCALHDATPQDPKSIAIKTSQGVPTFSLPPHQKME